MKLLFILLLATVALAADTRDTWPMRWRVYADPVAGIAFRHPYDVIPKELDAGELYRINPDTWTFAPTPTIRVFTRTNGDARAAGAAEAGADVAWSPWLPVTAKGKKPGPGGVLGTVGKGATERTILAIGLDTRTVGLVLAGGPEDGDNPGILASAEALVAPPKSKVVPATSRDLQGRQGIVWDATGKPVDHRRTGKVAPVPWAQAWEMETEHYHLTSNTSPARLAWHGAYLEALYRAYAVIYQPARMPPGKCEVHLFNTQAEFRATANAWGSRLPPPSDGSILGGFFAPGLASLWVYEESGILGGSDMAIEHVIAHECSHQFLHLATNGNRTVPTWLNEGLAVYFESGVFRDGQFQIRSPAGRLDRLKALYQEQGDTLAPLDQYIDHRGHISPDQYGEVYAMTHFWLFGACNGPSCRHQTCGLARFRRYWADLKTGADGSAAFEKHFLADMIAAKGGREQALAAWKTALLTYAKTLK